MKPVIRRRFVFTDFISRRRISHKLQKHLIYIGATDLFDTVQNNLYQYNVMHVKFKNKENDLSS